MDLEKYISSGILEEYVLNSASPQERQEVECLSHIYPEIKTALIKLESTIENFAQSNAIDPPKELKAKILSKIQTVDQYKSENSTLINLEHSAEKRNAPLTAFRVISIAATICLLLGLGFATFSYYNQVESLENKVANQITKETQLENQIANLEDNLDTAEAKIFENKALMADLASFSTQKIQLAGTDLSPDSKVNVFWNNNSENVYLKVDELPETSNDKQYQLWAIVNGQPADMGVFDLASASSLQQMPYSVNSAQAFAITLEEKGGSKAPTLSNLYVIGNV